MLAGEGGILRLTVAG